MELSASLLYWKELVYETRKMCRFFALRRMEGDPSDFEEEEINKVMSRVRGHHLHIRHLIATTTPDNTMDKALALALESSLWAEDLARDDGVLVEYPWMKEFVIAVQNCVAEEYRLLRDLSSQPIDDCSSAVCVLSALSLSSFSNLSSSFITETHQPHQDERGGKQEAEGTKGGEGTVASPSCGD